MIQPLIVGKYDMADKNDWDGRGKGSPLGNLIFVKIITIAGPLPAYILLVLVSFFYALFDKKGKAALRSFHKRIGFSKTSIWHCYRHFYTFGMALIDRVTFTTLKKTPYSFTFDNEEYIVEARKRGRGVVAVSAHIGNYEIAGNLLADHFDTCIHAVILDNEKQKIKEVFQETTERRRFNIIPISENGLAMMVPIKAALQNNDIVCFHGDRVYDSSRVSLPFLGGVVEFPVGPFQIAAITGTPIVPVCMVKTGMYRFTTKAAKPIYFDEITRDNREDHIKKAITGYISFLEAIVKKHPYQWYNFYDLWS